MTRSTQQFGGPCGSAQLGQSPKAISYNQKADSGQFFEGPEGGEEEGTRTGFRPRLKIAPLS